MRSRAAVLVLLLAFSGAAMVAGALRTSTTFDEIVLVSSGVRVLERRGLPLASDQPPLVSYLYALPVVASGAALPPEEGREWDYRLRWEYARDLYFQVGNDPERIAFLSRSVAILIALGLVVLAFVYGRWIAGAWVGLLAAGLLAFLPDLLAHGAISYNDIPLALAYLAALWAADAFVRSPNTRRGVVAGLLAAAALGVKYSAVALVPAGAALLLLEVAARHGGDSKWWKDAAVGGLAALAAAYVATVLIYRGDVWLLQLEAGLRATARHAEEGHPASAYLLGRMREGGFWYFFPVAFLFKTPAALHLLFPVALWGLLRRSPGTSAGSGPSTDRDVSGWAELASSKLRGPAVGFLVFGAFLLATGLDVGFRYALPALPPLLLLTATGLASFVSGAGRRQRLAVGVLLALYAGSTLSVAPHWLGYVSEWGRGRAPGDEALLDSSVDWGQGLVELRDYMEEEGVERVRLGYFGSALPGAYGISYEALPSFLPLPPMRDSGGEPARVTVLSATNLRGLYFGGADPFAAYRDRTPDRVLAGSLYVFDDR